MGEFQVITGENVPIKAWTKHVPPIEDSALVQLHNVASLPFIYRHVAVMPDVHCGYGATIGSVIPTRGAIVPSCVGVDLGCGVNAIRTGLTANDLPDNLHTIRTAIERAVPHGRTKYENDKGSWGEIPQLVGSMWSSSGLQEQHRRLVEKHPALQRARSVEHLCTLGTGNHFIEVCLDLEDRVWVMLHSGSRGIGNKIGTYFIERAKKQMERFFIHLPDKDLAYLPENTQDFDDYIKAVTWAQDFALCNRRLMLNATLNAIAESLGREILIGDEAISCHHNYIAHENHYGANIWVTRKGAVRARKGDMGIIPGSMGTRSFIVRGKGNPQSFNSCSHGAGRVMSRTKARATITVEDHKKATKGVECRKDESVLDESPAAYKRIEDVMRSQDDLVEIVHELHQIVCVKG